MAERDKETTVEDTGRGQYVVAEGIWMHLTGSTASGVPEVRTVATTRTTGELQIRYTPRQPKASESADTTS